MTIDEFVPGIVIRNKAWSSVYSMTLLEVADTADGFLTCQAIMHERRKPDGLPVVRYIHLTRLDSWILLRKVSIVEDMMT